LTTWNVATAREVHSVGLPLASSADVQGLTLAPDDSHIIVGAGADTSDIWLLEQFEPRSGRPSWLRW
jgi:hypothetical protein